MKLWQKNVLILSAVAVIAAFPLTLSLNSEFGGADGKAEEVITEMNPDYVPWFDTLFELPGGEVETLLFTVQAGLGAGVLGFLLGRLTAKPKRKPNEHGERCAAN